MDKQKFLTSGLLEQYVLGLTDPEESDLVERYLEAFPELKKEVDGMHSAIEQYALAHSIPPPPHMKEKIQSQIKDLDKQVSKSDSVKSVPLTSPRHSFRNIAAILGLGVLSLTLYIQNIGLKGDKEDLRQSLATQEQACEERVDQLEQSMQRPFAFLTEPETKTVILKGSGLAPEAESIVFWNPIEKLACLNIMNLPEPPDGKQYQIWADVNGVMIDMGLLEANKETIQMVDFIANAESFNITLEPKGGSEHPTVELLYANGLNG